MNLKSKFGTTLFSLALLVLASSCATGPSIDAYKYRGEAVNTLQSEGVLRGFLTLPLDHFPFDNRKANIVFRKLSNPNSDGTRRNDFQYRKAVGEFYLKLPVGEYEVVSIDDGGLCSDDFLLVPESLSFRNLRAIWKTNSSTPLAFEIKKGVKSDLGNLLLTCHEWNARSAFRETYTEYTSSTKIETYSVVDPTNPAETKVHCNCHLLRKFDD